MREDLFRIGQGSVDWVVNFFEETNILIGVVVNLFDEILVHEEVGGNT